MRGNQRLLLAALALSLTAACAGSPAPTADPRPTGIPTDAAAQATDPAAETELAADMATAPLDDAASADVTPDVTFQPTEFIPTPESLNRSFDDTPEMQQRRERLVNTFIDPVVSDDRVVEAARRVPRHSFIPTESLDLAYNDHPLPIGFGQTISQPSLVAMMTELLEIEPGDKVLEIGTGSGYQAAILRELTDQVYTVEVIPELTATARAVLDALGYGDIHVDRRDGYFGWAEHAPFDAIIVTAAPDHLPSPLVAQLNPDGGRMVIPIGPVGDVQTLWLVTRDGEDVQMERLMDVIFVPFTREP